MHNFVPENFHMSLFCENHTIDEKNILSDRLQHLYKSAGNGKDGKRTPENCHFPFMLSPHQPCKHLYQDIEDGKRPQKIVTFLLCYCCKTPRRHLLSVFLGTEYGKMRHLPVIVIVMVALWFKHFIYTGLCW